ncbi:MAG: GntR family transcriptional regulator, partial [Victivallales bacterium]|nr:GntR family transcriptional regulator [Victivallales bacterium]
MKLKTVCKHEQLTALLWRELREKEFPGRRFYTAKYLMAYYRISQATLTRALRPLYDDGLIYAVSGKGTFVTGTAGSGVTASAAAAGNAPLYCIFSDTEMFSRETNPTDWF